MVSAAAGAGSAGWAAESPASPWTAEWDKALLASAAERASRAFDPAKNMLRTRLGAEYHYHTNLRGMEAHPVRDSMNYGLLLLETGNVALGSKVIDAVIALQDRDPASKWFGLWSYYLEEPLPKMDSADYNWADFNGAALVQMERRHGAKLEPGLRKRVRESIGMAAACIRKRNVSMSYTNIAIQGTFVTLAAAEILEDRDLLAYASERLRRFAANVDITGSFAEYNSPTYANVSIANLTRIRMHVRHEASVALSEKIHERFWQHLALHWHAPTRQFAGPLSRCYSTDIGKPLWLQKALNNRLNWVPFGGLPEAGQNAEIALLDLKVPEKQVPLFLKLDGTRQHREVFLPAPSGESSVPPVQGTTYLTPSYCLGSVNRGDLWVQRRSLLAYWGDGVKVRAAHLRFLHDDYDLASALFYSVQEGGYALGLVNFRTPGGDKHLSLDPLEPDFASKRLYLRLDLPDDAAIRKTGPDSAIVALGPGLELDFVVRAARWNEYAGKMSVARGSIQFDLQPEGTDRVRWAEVKEAWLVFTLAIRDSGSVGKSTITPAWNAGKWEWRTPAGTLRIAGGKAVGTAAAQDKAYAAWINGKPAPMVRLSDERLV